MPNFLEQHYSQVTAAAERIRPYIRWTPALTTDLNPDLILKPECLQVTGSFKARGAFNALMELRRREPGLRGVLTVSSGNHAQAVALAARTFGIQAVILIPEGGNPAKIAATRSLGAEVITQGITAENRETRARQVSEQRGLHLIHPFDNWDVIHGQGTAALELLTDRADIKTIVAPVGGGGLISGTALAARGTGSGITVIGVEPVVAADAAASLRTGSRHTLDHAPDTIADGVRTLALGERTFETIVRRRLVSHIVTVSEEEIATAAVVAWEKLKLAVEPTGALPLAAFLTGKLADLEPPWALILSGGNFDRALVARLLDDASLSSGG